MDYLNVDLNNCFRRLDKNRSGYIVLIDVQNLLEKFGFSHKTDEIYSLIKVMDVNNSNKIAGDEFLKICLPLPDQMIDYF